MANQDQDTRKPERDGPRRGSRISSAFLVLALLAGSLPQSASASNGSVSLNIYNVGAGSPYTGSLQCQLYDSSGKSQGTQTTTSGNCYWNSVSSGSYTFVWKPYATGALSDEYWGSKIFSSVPYTGSLTRTAPYGYSGIPSGSSSKSVGDTTTQALTVKNDRSSAASVKMLCAWDVAGDGSFDVQETTSYVSVASGETYTFSCSHTIGSEMAGKTYKFGYEVITDLTSTGGSEWVTDSYWTTATLKVASAATYPGPPQSMSAAPGNGQNALGWNAPASDGGSAITGYRVFRGTLSGSESFVTTGGCANPGVALSCTDTGLSNGQAYYYWISAVNSVGQGAHSNEASATPVAPAPAAAPAAPSGMTATPGTNRVDLSWIAPSGTVTGYHIYRKATGTEWAGNARIADSTTTSYSDTTGTCGTSYDYDTKAYNGAGDSAAYSAVVTATPACPSTPPAVPAAPTGMAATPGANRVDLSWTAPAGTVTGYHVYRKVTGTDWAGDARIADTSSTSYADTAGTCGTSYDYDTKAYNGAGDSAAYSSVVTATLQWQGPSNDVSQDRCRGRRVPPRRFAAYCGRGDRLESGAFFSWL